MRFLRYFIVFSILIFLYSCSTNVKIQTPYLESYKQSVLNDDFWKFFNNKELLDILEKALNNNLDLKIQRYKLQKSIVDLRVQKSSAFKDISLNLGASRNAAKNSNRDISYSNSYTLNISTQYEIDMWGRIKSGVDAASFGVVGLKEAYKTIALTVASNAASVWLNIVACKEKLDLLKEKEKLALMVIKLNKEIYKNGGNNFDALINSKKSYKSIKESIAACKKNLETNKHRLSLIIGIYDSNMDIKTYKMPIYKPICRKIPVEILKKRPDVENAYYSLLSKYANLKQKKAEMFPKLVLSPDITYSSSKLNSMFDNWILKLAVNVFYPVIDYKRRALDVKKAKLQIKESLESYKKTLLNATVEAQDTLSQCKELNTKLKLRTKKIKLQSIALKRAQKGFLEGEKSLIETLNNKMDLIDKKIDLIDTNKDLLINKIDIYRVCGGKYLGKRL